ncbi:MAG: TIGR00270 family protein, partial [Candidatus Aenigmarchaeota archaeon]|nr:TIGR00270 family protein [Candidatus Aenigmarchaeota archaeon]MCK5062684.1 TIGR00270 family protein [Candidatus Aenigmarchaeota archaeon]MCK5290252.1 TIGR00270 family protein [Candidatus Aenigmarchaeota archaeon]
MGACDICGSTRETRKTSLEGADIEACYSCVPGKKERTYDGPRRNVKKDFKKRPELPKVNFEFVDDFGDIIKKAREKADITQKDFGLMVNEHSSVIQKIEHNDLKPRLGLAKKIEKKLKIRIINKIEQLDKDGNVVNNKKPRDDDKNGERRNGSRNGMSRHKESLVYTLADAIKIKKSK